MPEETAPPNEITQYQLVAKVAKNRQADVYFYVGDIERPFANQFRQCVLDNATRPNALLLLTTFGGFGDAAFQMARCLHSKYDSGTISVLVATFCKSAGTLVTLGAKNVIINDLTELGLLGERTSGLTPSQSLTTLGTEAFKCFEKFFLDILGSSGHTITTKTAAMIATKMTVGLYQPIYSQIDPMRLGEFQRAVQIAMEYGRRLDGWEKNLKDRALGRLISGYP